MRSSEAQTKAQLNQDLDVGLIIGRIRPKLHSRSFLLNIHYIHVWTLVIIVGQGQASTKIQTHEAHAIIMDVPL